jgi:hypothetical protein
LKSPEDFKQVGNQPRRFVFSISIIPHALISDVIEFLIIVVDVMKIIKCFSSKKSKRKYEAGGKFEGV